VFVQLLHTSIDRDLCLYRQQDITLWLVHVKIFPKQTKSQNLIGLYLFKKNQIVRFGKPDGPIFTTLASSLIFFYLGPLMPLSPFSSFKTPWIFKSLSLTPWFGSKTTKIEYSGLANRIVYFFQHCQIWSSTTSRPHGGSHDWVWQTSWSFEITILESNMKHKIQTEF
jgi:hypothetical protein